VQGPLDEPAAKKLALATGAKLGGVVASGTANDVPSYSAALVRAFVGFLPANAAPGTGLPALDLDDRVPISVAHQLLGAVIEQTGDLDLGLKVGRTMSAGDAGVADYAIRSAATVHDAIEVAARYIRLVNDGLELRLHHEGDRVVLQWESMVVMPRAAEDFLMSAIYTSHMRMLLRDAPELECWFTYPKPSTMIEYERTFGAAKLRFVAPFAGYAFDSGHLRKPVEAADAKLHSVLRQHAEALLGDLPASRTFTDRVRHHLSNDLSHGRPSASKLARRLQMSARTLERRLECEGTTFGAVLEDLRRRLALEHLGRRDVSLSEIAFLLGFSQVGAFHRAFRRWTGTTPFEYRRQTRRAEVRR
jgi:AraC-like DNA-binding protein